MTLEIPTARPDKLTAGDTWQWTRELADHPAGTWSLVYYLENKDATIAITATQDGSSTRHAVLVAAATTVGYKPGRYRVFARATSAGVVHSVVEETGFIDVLPDYSLAGTMDHRSWAQRVLDALRAAYEGRADSDQLSTSVNGRAISRMTKKELREEIEAFERRVQREADAAAINEGQASGNRILVRG